MTIRVARVPYLSHEPFYFDMANRGLVLHNFVPGHIASAIENGDLDAGPLPLGDSFRLEERMKPVAGFCLSVYRQAGSSFLFSKEPIDQLGGVPIGAPEEPSTSKDLLRVLLSAKYGLQPGDFTSMNDSPDAVLLMDDQGLRRRRGIRSYPHKYDLGIEWNQWTGLPFVFARWMRRNDMEEQEAALLEDTLYVGLEEGVDGLYHLNEPRENLLMLAKDIVEYIQGVRYFMGLSEQKSIELFREYWEQTNA